MPRRAMNNKNKNKRSFEEVLANEQNIMEGSLDQDEQINTEDNNPKPKNTNKRKRRRQDSSPDEEPNIYEICRNMQSQIDKLASLIVQNNNNEKETTQPTTQIPLIHYGANPYNILNIEKPKFHIGKTQPVTFMEDLMAYLKRLPCRENDLDIVYECLDGEARNWARVYRHRWNTFEEFKSDFLQTFWGDAEQNKVLRDLEWGRWDRKKHPSMLEYFLMLTGPVRMLTKPLTDEQILFKMARHYPSSFQHLWQVTGGNTILEFTEFLRHRDNIDKLGQDALASSWTDYQKETINTGNRTYNKENYANQKHQNNNHEQNQNQRNKAKNDIYQNYKSNWRKPAYQQENRTYNLEQENANPNQNEYIYQYDYNHSN